MSCSRQPYRSVRPVIATLAALALAATSGSLFAAEAATLQTERVSVSSAGVQGNRGSGPFSDEAVTADGRYVAFISRASNLVPNDTNQAQDVFVRDRLTHRTERVSIGNGHQANRRSFGTDISAEAATSCSAHRRPTWSAATTTAPRTCSCATEGCTEQSGYQ